MVTPIFESGVAESVVGEFNFPFLLQQSFASLLGWSSGLLMIFAEYSVNIKHKKNTAQELALRPTIPVPTWYQIKVIPSLCICSVSIPYIFTHLSKSLLNIET